MFKNDLIHIVEWACYKCGEFSHWEARAFHSRKQARNFNRKHLGGCGRVSKLLPTDVVHRDYIQAVDGLLVWF